MSLRWFAPRQLVAVRGAPGLLRWLPCTDFAHPTGCLRRRPRRNSKQLFERSFVKFMIQKHGAYRGGRWERAIGVRCTTPTSSEA